jgi:DNA polymerase-3 subunit epsilon
MTRSRVAAQQSFDDLGTPLYAVTFVVVDLETTGGSPEGSRITEFGAVKVRAGELLGEFASLVDPCTAIPASISALTGITRAMVEGRPPVEAVLPSFLEFCRGATLVAHNARFDVGFLNANLARLDYPGLANPVVCTASLARRLVRDEVRDCRLATLAQFFRTRTRPVHRALADARATVEVFHGLLERAGSFGVVTLEDLVGFAKVRNTPLFKARRSLADGLPHAPGVYAFRSASGEVLYVGKATDLRDRVRSYFGGDQRRKVVDLLKESAVVDHWVCPTPLEAGVREVRLIHAHRPRFNRRSKAPDRRVWLKLTAERFPRLSVVRTVREDGAVYLGPLPSRRAAEEVAEALHEVVPIRRCSARIGASTRFPACALAEMGRCLAPCDGRVSVDRYAQAAGLVAGALTGDPSAVVVGLETRMRALAAGGRFEEAAAARNRLRTLVTALLRSRRTAALLDVGLLVACRPGRRPATRELAVVRAGRLAATAVCPATAVSKRAAELCADHAAALMGSAPTRSALTGPALMGPALMGPALMGPALMGPSPTGPPLTGPAPTVDRTDVEEVTLVAAWLDAPGVRLHTCDAGLARPVAGGRLLADLARRLDRSARPTARPESELAAKRTRRPARPDPGCVD